MIPPKAAVFDPYLDTLGGGEVYTASVAASLLKLGYSVDIFWDKPETIGDINKYLGISLDEANLHQAGYLLFKRQGNLIRKLCLSRQYALFFYLSDGSLPFLASSKNLLHFQVPFTGLNHRSLVDSLKLKLYDRVVCNSGFTKKFIDREFGISSVVLYPPVNINLAKQPVKENIILSVGRFTDLLHNKRQDVLVRAFQTLIKQTSQKWTLILLGNDREGKTLVKKIIKDSRGYPIQVINDADHCQLENYYASSKIYWHAAGYGIDENKNPESVEHFGISTAEAMSAGCVPVVINKGGQPEIVRSGGDGFLWDSTDQLVSATLKLINEPETIEKFSRAAVKASRKFSRERFYDNFTKLIID